jgi:DNA-binding PadR family transcriptional regulator
MTAERSPETLLPLSAVAFEILLTLADGDSHGYHIMQEVERRTNGAITLHPGTLYRALARLLEQDVIDELDGSEGGPPSRRRRVGELGRSPGEGQAPRAVKKDDGRRRSYRLTRFGRAVLAAEAARLEQQVREARARRLLNRQER